MLGNCDPQSRNARTLSSSNGCHVVHTIDQSLSSIESENFKEYWRNKRWAYAHVRFCVLCLWGNRSVTCHWNQCLETIWVRTLNQPPQPCCLTWACGPSCLCTLSWWQAASISKDSCGHAGAQSGWLFSACWFLCVKFSCLFVCLLILSFWVYLRIYYTQDSFEFLLSAY